MNRPLRIGLDIDGVIAEYKDIPIKERTPDVYDTLKPVSSEVMVVFATLAMCYEVFLISSRRYRNAQRHTLAWLERHTPSWAGRVHYNLLTGVAPKDKWMVAAALKLDVLVDDNVEVFDDGRAPWANSLSSGIKPVLVGASQTRYRSLMPLLNLTGLPELLTGLGWRTEFQRLWYANNGEDIFLSMHLEFQPCRGGPLCTVFKLPSCVVVNANGISQLSRRTWEEAVLAAYEAATVL